MAKTPAERSAELKAKYGIAPAVPQTVPQPIPKPEQNKLVSITSKALEQNKKSLFEDSDVDEVIENYNPPISSPKPVPQPIKIPARNVEQPKKKGRPKKEDIIQDNSDVHWFREFLRKVFDPSRKKESVTYKVAEFKSKYESDIFMKMIPNSEYKAEGVVHKIMLLDDDNSDNDFFSRSKTYGAISRYSYTTTK